MKPKLGAFDRFLMSVAPGWALSRIRSRAAALALARYYEAAQGGRRTNNWPRSNADANAALGPALPILRAHARDLVRNNSWAKNGLRTIATNTVGWGIAPKPVDTASPEQAKALWKKWAGTTQCDADGRLNFYGLQRLVMREVAEAGEVLIRRRIRRESDGLAIPMQLQVLEADYLDTTKHGLFGIAGGPIIQGIEFDKLGRRAAYWLWQRHPGANYLTLGSYMNFASKRVPADEITHIYDAERSGQVRGVSWFSTALVNLKDFDEFEDAALMKQKIAALFSAFITDPDGAGASLGQETTNDDGTPGDYLEPGAMVNLPPGKQVTFAEPPSSGDDGFTTRQLRRIAAGLGVTYEDLTGDYSQVNFSSARMSRLKHWANVHDWRWLMLIPQMCDVAWGWAMDTAFEAGLLRDAPAAEWTAPPMPMIEPDKEGLALSRLVRAGAMTPSEMVREQGQDPETHWVEYAADLKMLDAKEIVLDCDPRRTNQSGQAQQTGGEQGDGGKKALPAKGSKGSDSESDDSESADSD